MPALAEVVVPDAGVRFQLDDLVKWAGPCRRSK